MTPVWRITLSSTIDDGPAVVHVRTVVASSEAAARRIALQRERVLHRRRDCRNWESVIVTAERVR